MPADLVLLHGFTQTGASWERVVRGAGGTLPRARARPPGHGRRPRGRPSFDRLRGATCARSRRPFTLAGYSMGGRIALHARAARSRSGSRGSCSIGASPGLADAGERARAARGRRGARRPDRGDRRRGVRRASGRRSRCSPASRRAVAAAAHADRLRNSAAELAAALRGLGTGVMPPLWDRLGELAMPVTLVVGERDAKFRAIAERMAAALPDAALDVVPGAGHAVQLEAPEAVAAAIAG